SLPHRALLSQEPDPKRWLWQMASLQGKRNHMDGAPSFIGARMAAAWWLVLALTLSGGLGVRRTALGAPRARRTPSAPPGPPLSRGDRYRDAASFWCPPRASDFH